MAEVGLFGDGASLPGDDEDAVPTDPREEAIDQVMW
jgi:hypothetical protein